MLAERFDCDDENVEPIRGRPDLHGHPHFGYTEAKTFPPYVFGIRSGSALVHKVRGVDLKWYRVGGPTGSLLVRLKRPIMFARTKCGYSFRLNPEVSRTCQTPRQDALHCMRCQGFGPVFPKGKPAISCGLTRAEAKVRLGCVVNGY